MWNKCWVFGGTILQQEILPHRLDWAAGTLAFVLMDQTFRNGIQIRTNNKLNIPILSWKRMTTFVKLKVSVDTIKWTFQGMYVSFRIDFDSRYPEISEQNTLVIKINDHQNSFPSESWDGHMILSRFYMHPLKIPAFEFSSNWKHQESTKATFLCEKILL